MLRERRGSLGLTPEGFTIPSSDLPMREKVKILVASAASVIATKPGSIPKTPFDTWGETISAFLILARIGMF
jgi:hypothetical protein